MSLKKFCNSLLKRTTRESNQIIFSEMSLMNTFSFLGGEINLGTFSQEVINNFSNALPTWSFKKQGELIVGQKWNRPKYLQKEAELSL